MVQCPADNSGGVFYALYDSRRAVVDRAIGLALGWFVDHRIVTAEAKLWTNRAVDAEMAMKSDGWIVDWRDADRGPYFVYPNGRTWAPYGR